MKRGTILWNQMFWLPILLVGLPGQPWAGEPTPHEAAIELGPLVHEALQNNPELVAIRAQAEALQERVPQSRSLEDPELTIRLWNTPESLNLTRSERTIYGLGQRFPFPGTLSKQEQIAVKVAEQAGQRLAAKEREIVAAVKVAYYELFYTHEAIVIHHEEAKRLKQFFKTATAKFRVGKGTQVDVLKAQVEQSKWFQHLPLLEQQRETARGHLNTLLNREPQALLGVPGAPVGNPTALSVEHLQKQALQQRPEVREIALAVEQFDSTIKLAELQTYPHLYLEVQRWQNYNANDGFGGIVSLNLPFAFWTKSKYEAGVREAMAQREMARFKKKTLENLTRFQIQDFLAQIEAKEKILTLYRTTVLPQAKHTLKAALAGYRTDRTDFLDLIEADRALLTYQLEYVRTLVEWKQLLAKLERIVGAEL